MSLPLYNPVLNAQGAVAFNGTLSFGATEGIFARTTGAVQTVALANASTGVNFFDLDTPVLNSTGQVAFRAVVGGSGAKGVFVGTTSSIQSVAQSGTTSPNGGTFTDFASPGINGQGRVVFTATMSGSSTSGIFSGSSTSLATVALSSSPAPSGGNYSSFSFPVINNANQVAYRATLTGTTSTEGIFVGLPGSIQAVALRNTPAPGGGSFNALGSPVLNGIGQVAFTASLTGAGNNDFGLYAGMPGSIVRVVGKGDIIDVDPGVGIDMRTVLNIGFLNGGAIASGGADGREIRFTDFGTIAYTLTFTDGSSGVFTSVIPVPEPINIGFIGAGCVAMMCWLRQRKACRTRRCSRPGPPHRFWAFIASRGGPGC
jgi:hypothetical protein